VLLDLPAHALYPRPFLLRVHLGQAGAVCFESLVEPDPLELVLLEQRVQSCQAGLNLREPARQPGYLRLRFRRIAVRVHRRPLGVALVGSCLHLELAGALRGSSSRGVGGLGRRQLAQRMLELRCGGSACGLTRLHIVLQRLQLGTAQQRAS
jgi:hypothetical protein